MLAGPGRVAAGARARAARRRALRELPLRARSEQIFRDEIARRARELGLQPLRWPDPFPFDSTLAMRVATYAKSIGRVVPFAQAAFRQAFAGGHSLAGPDYVLIAAAACEMHPAAVLRGAELRSVARAARERPPRARPRRGTSPTCPRVSGRRAACSHGERALEDAAAAHAARGGAGATGGEGEPTPTG